MYKKICCDNYVEAIRSVSARILVDKSTSTPKIETSVMERTQNVQVLQIIRTPRLASLPGDKEVKLQIFMSKFAKFKIYHVNYRRNLSLELKQKGFHAQMVGFFTTNSVINRLKLFILKVFEKVIFDDIFCELGELFFL